MLSPYRVLDLADERGHFAGFILAMLGADVLAVEPAGGSPSRRIGPFAPDGHSLAHLAYNRGKRSLQLDLSAADGRDDLLALAAVADVLVESGPPGHLGSLGLGYDELAEANPGLVVVSITPFGQTGPKAHWHATDLTVWASSGSMALCGDADRAPLGLAVPQAFLHAGAQAAAAALVALAERARSGRGQHVDVAAQTAAMLATQSASLNTFARTALARRAGGGMRSGDVFLRFVYPTLDGHVSITHVFGAAVGPVTARLMAWVHEEGFCDEATRDKDWVAYGMQLSDGSEPLSELDRVQGCVAAFTATRTKADLFAEAQRRRLLLAPIATPAEVLSSEQLAQRRYWDDVEGLQMPGPWAHTTAVPLRRLGPAPKAGQHDDSVSTSWAAPRVDGASAGDANRVPAMPADDRPLAGLKVVDFMWAVAGPTLSRLLADAGATVVRVESSTKLDAARAFLPFFDDRAGAESSALFNNLNAGKLSITLDLRRDGARQVAGDLCRWADVVCEAYSPRAMRGWGLDYERLRSANPGLVMLSTCLFGHSGPLADFAGYGNLGAALTGFYAMAGWPDRDPVGPYGAYTDYASPHLALATLLAALDHRRRTGEGQYLDFSQAEASIHFLAPAVLAAQLDQGRTATGPAVDVTDAGSGALDNAATDAVNNADTDAVAGPGAPPLGVRPAGNHHPQFCPHGVFPALGDDRWVAIVAQDQLAWAALAALLGRADLAGLTIDERLARRPELERLVACWSAGRTAGEAERCCQDSGVAAHQVANAAELAGDPQLAARGHWVRVDHPLHGETVVEGPRFVLSRSPLAPARGGPLLGEHTYEVLADLLGYSEESIAELAAAECFD
jgi:crotonobetainyl-CoA:carnitine CoA-transferase CaiB-like acyl-CoA transferase